MGFQSTAQAFAVQGISGPQKAVLVALAHCRNEKTEQCNPGHAVLVKMTSLSEKTVRRALADLENDELGLITRVEVSKGHIRIGTSYQLHFDVSQSVVRATSGQSDQGSERPEGVRSERPEGVVTESLTPGRSDHLTGREQELKGEPPARRCSRHLNDLNPPSCGACREARLERESWDAAHKPPPASTPRPPKKGECQHRERDGFCMACGDDLREKGAA